MENEENKLPKKELISKVNAEREWQEEPKEEDFKKYIVRVKKENIHVIERMSYMERNDFFNTLLGEHKSKAKEQNKVKQMNMSLKTVLIVLMMIFAVPLAFTIINFLLNVTQTNYAEFQQNFQQLFNSRLK